MAGPVWKPTAQARSMIPFNSRELICAHEGGVDVEFAINLLVSIVKYY